jgi:hypothetical protein
MAPSVSPYIETAADDGRSDILLAAPPQRFDPALGTCSLRQHPAVSERRNFGRFLDTMMDTF